MTADHDHPGDELVDLALGQVTGERRTTLARHLLVCPACRHEYDDLVAAVEGVVVAAPAVDPPIGFDERTLAGMGIGPVAAPASGRSPRWLPLVAAALVVVALAAGGAWWAFGADPSSGPERVAAITTTADGRGVGTATATEVDGEPVLVVGLTTGPEGATYTCRMRFADGTTVDTEPWSADPGAGWLVALPTDRGDLTGIELVAPGTGEVWSTADLDE
ncbi:hypothetical protein HC251_21525 [Iamia sp. SCSIO 61187]|uniref:hypothetical protein n=1 Tax=Iamia sp. SCSIO 61187 TaxID=2722752 RepID=UPI001C62DB0B|nr:hypothetical protein [Iamia sp. SCSIO 61187]QYG94759.1 hypothetical protein HC251_21525 [Iamia sp. SCSIO 61187]